MEYFLFVLLMVRLVIGTTTIHDLNVTAEIKSRSIGYIKEIALKWWIPRGGWTACNREWVL